MGSSDVSNVTKYFATAAEGFTTTLASTIVSGATSVPLNSTTGLTNGNVFVGIIEPGATAQQVFTGTVDVGGAQITNVVWTRGSNTGHAGGVTIVDYSTGTARNMTTAGILKQHTQAGAHTGITTDTLSSTGNVTVGGALAVTGNETVAGTLGVTGAATFSGAVTVPDANFTGAKLAANTVTPDKMLGIDVFGTSAAVIGVAPGAGTGQFYMQAGSSVGTTDGSGDVTVTFPTPFPNGVVSVVACQGDITAAALVAVHGVSTSNFIARFPSAGTGARVNYIAIGF